MMLTLTEFIVSLIAVWLLIFIWENLPEPARPPGPWRLPFLGTLLQVILSHKVYYLALHELSKNYGEVMSLKIGFTEFVILSSHQSAKSVLSNENALDRHCIGTWNERNLNQNIGLVMGNGNNWIELRKFCKDSLKKYGFGNRDILESIVQDEAVELCKRINDLRSDNKFNRIRMSHELTDPFAMNVLLTMFIGSRLPTNNSKVQRLMVANKNFNENIFISNGLLAAIPILEYFPTKVLGYGTQMKGIQSMHDVAREVLQSRKLDGLYKTSPCCFTDEFLQEIDANAWNPQTQITGTEDQFIVLFSDMTQAGFDTTSNTINYTILLLSMFPEVQEKMYQEIKTVCINERLPNLNDKAKMNYTRAVFVEIFRLVRVLPIGVPRKVRGDIPYKNFIIKKGTIIIPNFHSLFYNKNLWENPEGFNPERFVGKNGSFLKEKAEKVTAFGIGSRKCFGELIALDMLFLFVANLLQRYKFKLPNNQGPPSLDPMIFGVALCPQPFLVEVENRTL